MWPSWSKAIIPIFFFFRNAPRISPAFPRWWAGISSAIPCRRAFTAWPPGARIPFPSPPPSGCLYSPFCPGQVPPRWLARVIISFYGSNCIANVHLSHGQIFEIASSCRHIMEQIGRARRHHRRFQCRGPGGFPGLLRCIGSSQAHPSRRQNQSRLRLDPLHRPRFGLFSLGSAGQGAVGPSSHGVLDMKVDTAFHTATMEDSNLLAL